MLPQNISSWYSKLCQFNFKETFWPNLRRDVTSWSRGCIQCRKCKVSRHSPSQIGTFPLVSKRFAEIHLDIIGPLPIASGYRYCVTIVDRFTRWPEALTVMDIRAETTATAVYRGWIWFTALYSY
ncbi:integrase catalytic domain-containing protein [Trichonephila inaurata madagascariensis]|uniref:Integrase catalytic domain-containing protein n=1 Tax=Trichonephila inaurata madagascariensis TaxID=2747483 RepID=A0A8X6IMC2_9ARAC|nr:integrase catalytic domain-containing protein [Trichonephila inaurata madagascariensis]